MFSMPPRPIRRSGPSSRRRSHRPRSPSPWPSRRVFLGVLCVATVAALAWALWWSGVFSIDEIDVAGDDEHVVQVVRDHMRASLLSSNLLFIDSDLVIEELLKLFPWVKDVQIQRDWPSQLRVRLTAREPIGVWCKPLSKEQECYFFDEERTWGSAVPSRGTLLLTVMDEHPEGAPYAELVTTILMVSERLKSLDVNVSRITLPAGPLDEIHVTTTDGYPVIFSQETDLGEQFDVLEVFFSERRARGEGGPEFIDVRVPGKIYYK